MYIILKGEAVQVAKWGNSLAVRLPKAVVDALNLKEGDDITIHAVGERAFEVEKSLTPQEALARLRTFRGRLPSDFRFDRFEANERK
jgi:antitoxin MazE